MAVVQDLALVERGGDRSQLATGQTDELCHFRAFTPIQFSTARPAACKQNDGRCGRIMDEFDSQVPSALCANVVHSANARPARDGSAPNKYQSPSPDKLSGSIFKTRKCFKNSLLKNKRRRKSSQKREEDTSQLLSYHDSTKFTNLIADLDSTMNFLAPKRAVPTVSIAPPADSKNAHNASLQFFQINLLHPSKQFSVANEKPTEQVDAVEHIDTLQLFADNAIR